MHTTKEKGIIISVSDCFTHDYLHELNNSFRGVKKCCEGKYNKTKKNILIIKHYKYVTLLGQHTSVHIHTQTHTHIESVQQSHVDVYVLIFVKWKRISLKRF